MTGVLNAVAGLSSGASFSITTDNTGIGAGATDLAGVISPSAYKGSTITLITSVVSPSRFDFRLSADVTQSYFSELLVETEAGGSFKTFRSSDATFDTTGANQTTWRWSTSSDGTPGGDIWTSIGITRRVLIKY